MKYIISIIFIASLFIACNKKEVVTYNPSKPLKINNSAINIDKIVDSKSDYIIDKNEDIKENNKIAIVYSSKRIGKYSIKISDIVLAYSTNLDINFEYKFFDIKNENEDVISDKLDEIYDNNISKIMLYLTKPSLINIYKYDKLNKFNIYLPLINKNDTNLKFSNNIIFGGIDYTKQLDKLKDVATSHIIEIYDNKYRNLKLHNILKEDNNIISYILNGKYPNYKKFIETHPLLNDSSIILNLSVVKSSIFLSQLRANDDLNISQILTTQNNYTPLLFVLSQKKDTENLIVASGIKKINNKLYNMNKLIGNDIIYDWVNYSTILGLEYFQTKNKFLFENIQIIENQVDYSVDLFITKNNSFISYVKEQNDTIVKE